MAGYRMTPARKAALKKAQVASARKRKGTGKAKSTGVRRRKAQATPASRVRRRRAIVATVGAVGAAAGAGYVYKNREQLVIAPMARNIAVRSAKKTAKAQGKKLSKTQIRAVREEERKNHANRSRYRVEEYRLARDLYKTVSKKGYNLRPLKPAPLKTWQKSILVVTGNSRSIRPISGRNSASNKFALGDAKMQKYFYDTYRKDVNARAVSRLNRMKGQKQGFSYKSGKSKMVISGRVYRMPF